MRCWGLVGLALVVAPCGNGASAAVRGPFSAPGRYGTQMRAVVAGLGYAATGTVEITAARP